MRPDDRRYTESHEWAQAQGDLVTVGITDFAIEQLGELVFLELPEPGRRLEKGDALGEVESVKAVSDIYMPVAGEVVEVNQHLPDNLETLQEDPFGRGWLARIRVADPEAALAGLLDAAAYEQSVAAAE